MSQLQVILASLLLDVEPLRSQLKGPVCTVKETCAAAHGHLCNKLQLVMRKVKGLGNHVCYKWQLATSSMLHDLDTIVFGYTAKHTQGPVEPRYQGP